jgi:homogentisate solanesyltransferase
MCSDKGCAPTPPCSLAAASLAQATFSPLIFALFAFGTTIGGLYSVPPFQLKRFPLAAGMTIATCRGFLLNFGVYYATREALGQTFCWLPPVAFLARFMTVYAAVIAVTKDLGDIEGDRLGGIQTFASRFGPTRVALGASAALLCNYVGAIATGVFAAPGAFTRSIMIGGHALAAAWLVRTVNLYLRPKDGGEIGEEGFRAYYKQIWNLFYFEYLMYPFI